MFVIIGSLMVKAFRELFYDFVNYGANLSMQLFELIKMWFEKINMIIICSNDIIQLVEWQL